MVSVRASEKQQKKEAKKKTQNPKKKCASRDSNPGPFTAYDQSHEVVGTLLQSSRGGKPRHRGAFEVPLRSERVNHYATRAFGFVGRRWAEVVYVP